MNLAMMLVPSLLRDVPQDAASGSGEDRKRGMTLSSEARWPPFMG